MFCDWRVPFCGTTGPTWYYRHTFQRQYYRASPVPLADAEDAALTSKEVLPDGTTGLRPVLPGYGVNAPQRPYLVEGV